MRLLHVSPGATMEVRLLPDSRRCCNEANCAARVIQTGKPWQNGFIESIHSTLRREHLIVEVFFFLVDAQLKTGTYRNDTNQLLPLSARATKHQPTLQQSKLDSNGATGLLNGTITL